MASVSEVKVKIGEVATIAADRLMVIDPRGEIDENDLLEFLEKYVEPKFWPWLKEKREGLKTMSSKEIEHLQAEVDAIHEAWHSYWASRTCQHQI